MCFDIIKIVMDTQGLDRLRSQQSPIFSDDKKLNKHENKHLR